MKQIFFLFLMSCFWGLTYAETPQGNTPNDSLYQDAFAKIRAILIGESPLNFKKAVFLTENAFLDGGLSPHTFDIEIQFLANLAMEVANQEQLKYKFEDSTNIQKNWGLTRIFMDTFDVNFRGESKQWLPPQYHFDDPLGQKDWKNTFVSQLLKTGRGNCHSLPFLYKILAEETETNVSLALAPSHMYLKAHSANHKVGGYNIELTGKAHPIDGWIVTTSYISTDAIRSNLYMDDLNLKESIVLTLLDLAQGYEKKFPNADEEFVLMCIEEALKHFPDCVNAHLLKMEFLVNRYKVNQDKVIREQIGEECEWLLDRGYDEMPKEMYADGLTTPSRYKQNSQTYTTQNEQEANPYGFGITPTLTKGRYLETHVKDEVERIGSVLFNRKTGRVESIEEAQKVGDLTMSSTTVGRFLSVDPLTASFPMLTPYQFAGNTPIQAIDLEGLEAFIVVNQTVVDETVFEVNSDGDIAGMTKATTNTYKIPVPKSQRRYGDQGTLYINVTTGISSESGTNMIGHPSSMNSIKTTTTISEAMMVEDDGSGYLVWSTQETTQEQVQNYVGGMPPLMGGKGKVGKIISGVFNWGKRLLGGKNDKPYKLKDADLPNLKSMQTGRLDGKKVDGIKDAMTNNKYRYDAPEGQIGGFIDKRGNHIISEGNHRVRAAAEIFEETGNLAPMKNLLKKGRWTRVDDASKYGKVYNLPKKGK